MGSQTVGEWSAKLEHASFSEPPGWAKKAHSKPMGLLALLLWSNPDRKSLGQILLGIYATQSQARH